jgi:predicted dehydrogenase
MPRHGSISRRQVLAGATGAVLTRPRLVSAVPATERIALGFIGLGEEGMYLLDAFLAEPDAEIVALCDVEERHFRERDWGQGRPLGRSPARDRVSGVRGRPPTVVTDDMREVCGHAGLDAVVIATPDHWHALCTLEAIRQGKDVYCEKPLTHRFAEGQAVCRAVARRETVFQTGSQQRSAAEFRRAVELVRNGVLGDLERIEVGLPSGYEFPMGDPTVRPPPDADVYRRWCGPAAELPYMRARHHRWWRGHTAFGGGVLMDWIGHHNDIAHWSLDLDAGGPVQVSAEVWTLPATDIYDTPWHYTLRCEYPGGVTSTISDASPPGTRWIGTEGWLHVTRGRLTASDDRWLAADFAAGPFVMPPAESHVRDFLDGVRRRRPCVATAAIGHRSITPGHLGYVSHAVGRPLRWDAAAERIIDDAEAQRELERNDYRPPWHLRPDGPSEPRSRPVGP